MVVWIDLALSGSGSNPGALIVVHVWDRPWSALDTGLSACSELGVYVDSIVVLDDEADLLCVPDLGLGLCLLLVVPLPTCLEPIRIRH